MPAPLISVIMPVRDGERYLDECLASLRRQTVADLEILVIDDGSTDRTGAILARHAAEDARIRVESRPARGLVAALNDGFALARAPLAARMDADDVALPDRLERQLARLEGDPVLALVGSAHERIDGSGRAIGSTSPPTGATQVRAMLAERNCIAHPTVMVRREAVLALGGYRAQYRHCEDYDLWLRLSERADLINLPEPLLRYRVHAGSVSVRHLEQQIVSELGAIAASARRRQGLADPTPADGAVTREWLHGLGIGGRDIERRLRRAALGWARLMRKAGEPKAASELFALAERLAKRAGPLEQLGFYLSALSARRGV